MDAKEILASIATSASDIERWVLQMALSGRLSVDRRTDIAHAATRIQELNKKLSELSQ